MKEDPKDPKKKLEPFEELLIDTESNYIPMIIEKINGRKGVLLSAED
jgi:predicted membrane GTPase involved in stress response